MVGICHAQVASSGITSSQSLSPRTSALSPVWGQRTRTSDGQHRSSERAGASDKRGPILLDSTRAMCDTTASDVDTRGTRMDAERESTRMVSLPSCFMGVDWSVTSDRPLGLRSRSCVPEQLKSGKQNNYTVTALGEVLPPRRAPLSTMQARHTHDA